MDSISQECLQGRSSTGTSGVDLWTTIITTDDDEQGNFYDDCICGFLKSNGNGVRCFNKPKPPATKEQAIERYASEYSPEAICVPLKYNSPFQYTRTIEAPMVTRMSLSLETAQAVFALVGVLFVFVLRKIKKSDQAPSTLRDDDLRTLVQNHEELIQSLLKNSRDHQA